MAEFFPPKSKKQHLPIAFPLLIGKYKGILTHKLKKPLENRFLILKGSLSAQPKECQPQNN